MTPFAVYQRTHGGIPGKSLVFKDIAHSLLKKLTQYWSLSIDAVNLQFLACGVAFFFNEIDTGA